MTLAEAIDAERRRISEDLHDRTGPNLAAAALSLQAIEQKLLALEPSAVPPALHELLAQAQSLLADSVAQIRDLSAELRPSRLEYSGLAAALEDTLVSFGQRTGITVRFESEPSADHWNAHRLDAAQEWLLFRVAQEALGNCARHAQAGTVTVGLRGTDAIVQLRIADDGVGFDPDRLAREDRRPGLGLLVMRERVAQGGGRLRVQSRPGGGTLVEVELPALARA